MIDLHVISDDGMESMALSAPYFRITGGAVWIGPSATGEVPLVRYVCGWWQYSDVLWSGVRFDGKCRLVFGLAREPADMSDETDELSMHGRMLLIDGVPSAVFDDRLDMWRDASANRWWHAFRVESAEFRRQADETRRAPPSGLSDQPAVRFHS